MHDPPEREALLFAVAEFLTNDVKPLLTDPRLSFRALIAANLAQVVAADLGGPRAGPQGLGGRRASQNPEENREDGDDRQRRTGHGGLRRGEAVRIHGHSSSSSRT